MFDTLGNITTKIGSGATPRGGKSAYKESGITLIRSMNVYDFHFSNNGLAYIDDEQAKKLDNVAVQEGDILFNITGDSINRTCIVPKELLPARVNQHVSILRCKKGIDSRYVNNYLINLKPYLMQICGVGGTRNALTKEALENLPIKILANQKQIAKVLSDLDAKIELNNKINSELEAMAKLIYDYWFVQFDFPNENGMPYKSSGGKMVYNEELKREIPEGWKVKELGDEIDIQRGMSYKSSEIKGDGIPMINLNSFNLDGTYKSKGVKMFSGKYADKNLISSGDLLIAATDVTRNADIIGKAILVPDFYSDLVISMDIAKVIPSDNLSETYLMLLFNTEHYHNYIKWYASGTIVLHLIMDGMKWYKAEMPPKDILDTFDSVYKPIAKRISETTKQNQKLSELRDWLLPMLMNGQVKVK